MDDMIFNVWFVVAGALFVGMALAGSVLKRLPLTTSILYMLIGLALSPLVFGILVVSPLHSAALLERFTEVVVLISLFTAGLKLRTPLTDGRWRLPARLAFGSMIVTIGLVTLVGVVLLHLPLGAAVLLGAIVAPTDPVLASDVQVEDPNDRDRLRFALTSEAGLNDGTAFPFVMLGLGLLGLHEIGDYGWRWLALDVVWASVGGLGIGTLLGALVGRLVLYLRREHKEAVGLDDFLALGLIALAYGVALLAHTYGFLAVFAAGLALRRIERRSSGDDPPPDVDQASQGSSIEEVATHPDTASAFMAQATLGFSEQLERIGEVGVVLLLGGLLAGLTVSLENVVFVVLLLLVIRPISTTIGLYRSRTSRPQRRLIGWFGIRGVGSLYYLMYAIEHGIDPALAERLTMITLLVVATSVIVHGISVTPLMNRYVQRRKSQHTDDQPTTNDQRPTTTTAISATDE